MSSKIYPIGIQNFEKIRKDGYFYIDKTALIYQLEKDWIKHPILHLDLNVEKYDVVQSLDNILEKSLTAWEKLYGAEPSEHSFSLRFAGIIERAYAQTGQRVVILVDEYDKPMLQAIGNEELQKQFSIYTGRDV